MKKYIVDGKVDMILWAAVKQKCRIKGQGIE